MRPNFRLLLSALAFCVVAAGLFGAPALASSAEDMPFGYTSSDIVGQAQAILQHLGHLAPGSYKRGELDTTTEKALRSFQATHSLQPTGQVDGDTLTQLLQHRPGTDSDGDGVVDKRDKCPNTPRGAKVNAQGCSLDGDGDGVADDRDRCPDTPRGDDVDSNGCPVKAAPTAPAPTPAPAPAPTPAPSAAVPAAGTALVLEGVTFETNSARLRSDSIQALDRLAEGLKANPDVRVEIGGHTDSRGDATTNNRLSQARATAVRDYLVSKGVSAGRLEARGYGSSRPVDDNDTDEGRARNRRVEASRLN